MHTSSRPGPDEEPPTPEQLERWHQRMSAPENELPAGAGITALLARTDDAAVGITLVEVFSTGFRFTLAVRLRRSRPDFYGGHLPMLVGNRHPGIEIPLGDRLLLGIEYADGARASTLQDWRGPAFDDDGLQIHQQGGGGSDRTVDQDFWVSPLPPEGPVTFVLSWPAFGMPESRTVVDSAPIREAAGRAQELWPPQSYWEETHEPPPPPPRPETGWFSYPEG
ncbi:hypothetical protein [Paractinoplanes globisporus]|uniref:Uncharacterized protein n=1 Tax=Paractinoplanes globisporus TaxID=113565 RepID=A0ABW6WTP4_9ACTN|nr:hypothetical protein [Actinoplanes globisporus]